MAVEETENAAGDQSPAVTSTRTVDIVVSLILLALAALLAVDNWRTGMSWDASGPQAGYFPFYLSVILGAASIYGLVKGFIEPATEPFSLSSFFGVSSSAASRISNGAPLMICE